MSEIKVLTSTDKIRILVVGETGTGKSAICYNLGCKKSKSSDKPTGETLDYEIIKSEIYKNLECIDTCGFNEGKEGMITKEQAAQKFYKFCRNNKDGFNVCFLVKHPRFSENTDKNCVLVNTVLPDIPIILITQRCKQDWKNETCMCTKAEKGHKYGYHFPKEITNSTFVDLPGSDFWESEEAEELGPIRKKRISNDIKKLEEMLSMYGNKRYIISSENMLNGISLMINTFWTWVTGKVAIFTETMKKVVKALVESGMTKDEAEALIAKAEADHIKKV